MGSDCCKILQITCARMDPPEWYNCQHYDQYTREAVIRVTAGFGSGGGLARASLAHGNAGAKVVDALPGGLPCLHCRHVFQERHVRRFDQADQGWEVEGPLG